MLSHAPTRIVSITAILQAKPITAWALWRLQPLLRHILQPRLGSKQVAVWSCGLVWFSAQLHQKCLHNTSTGCRGSHSVTGARLPAQPAVSHIFSSLLSFLHTAEQDVCYLALFTLKYHTVAVKLSCALHCVHWSWPCSVQDNRESPHRGCMADPSPTTPDPNPSTFMDRPHPKKWIIFYDLLSAIIKAHQDPSVTMTYFWRHLALELQTLK